MHPVRKTLVMLTTTLAVAGSCLLSSGCDDVLEGAVNAISEFNPCGTILNCDPTEYEFLTSGIDGTGVNVEEDPYCVYPPYCTDDEDPIYGGLSED